VYIMNGMTMMLMGVDMQEIPKVRNGS